MKAKHLCLALAGAILTTVTFGPAEALVRQSYTPTPWPTCIITTPTPR